jgi:hypothetical protein
MADFRQSNLADASLAPPFHQPKTVLVPQVSSLLHGGANDFLEDGVAFSTFSRVSPDESSEAKVGGRTLNFTFHDRTAYVNCRRILLDITVSVVDDHHSNRNNSITSGKYLTTSNPPSHCLIDQINTNIGQCLLDKNDQLYGMIAQFKYLTEYSLEAKETWLKGRKKFLRYIQKLFFFFKLKTKTLPHRIRRI